MKYYWIILLLLLISCSNEKQSNKAQSSGSLLLGFEAYPHAFMSLPITIKGADLISPSGESHPILINERNINLADFQGFITAAAIPEGEYGTLRLLISLAETHNLTYNATEKAWIQTLLLNHEFKAIPSQQSTYEVTITPKAPIQIRANQAHLYSLNFLSNQLFSTALTDTHANYIQFHPAVELRPADKITLKGSIEFFGQQRVVINSTYLSVEANIDTIDVDGSSYSMTENWFDEIGFLNTSAVTATLSQSNTTQDLYANLSLSTGEQFNGYLIDEGNELKIAYPAVGDDAYPVLSKMAISWGNNLVINADKLHFTDDLSLLPGQQVQLFKSQGQETLKLLETNLLAKVVSAGNPLLVTPLFVNGMNAAGFSTEELYLRGTEPLPYKEGDLINTSGYFFKNDQSDFFALKHYALTNTQIEININFRPFSSVAMMYGKTVGGTHELFMLGNLTEKDTNINARYLGTTLDIEAEWETFQLTSSTHFYIGSIESTFHHQIESKDFESFSSRLTDLLNSEVIYKLDAIGIIKNNHFIASMIKVTTGRTDRFKNHNIPYDSLTSVVSLAEIDQEKVLSKKIRLSTKKHKREREKPVVLEGLRELFSELKDRANKLKEGLSQSVSLTTKPLTVYNPINYTDNKRPATSIVFAPLRDQGSSVIYRASGENITYLGKPIDLVDRIDFENIEVMELESDKILALGDTPRVYRLANGTEWEAEATSLEWRKISEANIIYSPQNVIDDDDFVDITDEEKSSVLRKAKVPLETLEINGKTIIRSISTNEESSPTKSSFYFNVTGLEESLWRPRISDTIENAINAEQLSNTVSNKQYYANIPDDSATIKLTAVNEKQPTYKLSLKPTLTVNRGTNTTFDLSEGLSQATGSPRKISITPIDSNDTSSIFADFELPARSSEAFIKGLKKFINQTNSSDGDDMTLSAKLTGHDYTLNPAAIKAIINKIELLDYAVGEVNGELIEQKNIAIHTIQSLQIELGGRDKYISDIQFSFNKMLEETLESERLNIRNELDELVVEIGKANSERFSEKEKLEAKLSNIQGDLYDKIVSISSLESQLEEAENKQSALQKDKEKMQDKIKLLSQQLQIAGERGHDSDEELEENQSKVKDLQRLLNEQRQKNAELMDKLAEINRQSVAPADTQKTLLTVEEFSQRFTDLTTAGISDKNQLFIEFNEKSKMGSDEYNWHLNNMLKSNPQIDDADTAFQHFRIKTAK